jgi:hypothetical protein
MRLPLRSFLFVLWLVGCESIAGIEDHVYQSSASTLCQEYCDVVLRACTGPNAVYSGPETCLGVCGRLPPGDPLEPGDDETVVCRKHQAELADSSGEPNVHCPRAGPGGAGTCGTDCASYCLLLKAACPDQASALTSCEKQCSALKDDGTFDAKVNHEGDTLQCRLVHVSSSTVDPATHCPHTQIHPTAPWCIDKQDAPPNCADFCRLALASCQGDVAVYESIDQCLAVCAALPPGTNGDRDQNTVGCRQWHCYNSLLDPGSHCPHTGPGGDAHCGSDQPDDLGNCHAYCILLEHACAADFAAKFPAGQMACQKDCSNQPDSFGAKRDSKYRIAIAQTGNTMSCRLLHVSRALTDATECPSAFGDVGSACQ